MTRLNNFLGDDKGAVTIDWVALTAGILLLGIMVVYAIFDGGVAGLVSNINATLAGVDTDIDTGSTPGLNGGSDVASVSLLELSGQELPVGTMLRVVSNRGNVRFSDPVEGTTLFFFRNPRGGAVNPDRSLTGATVASDTTLRLSDANGGTIVQVSDFFAPPT